MTVGVGVDDKTDHHSDEFLEKVLGGLGTAYRLARNRQLGVDEAVVPGTSDEKDEENSLKRKKRAILEVVEATANETVVPATKFANERTEVEVSGDDDDMTTVRRRRYSHSYHSISSANQHRSTSKQSGAHSLLPDDQQTSNRREEGSRNILLSDN